MPPPNPPGDTDVTTVTGASIGAIFSATVDDLLKSVPPNVTAAVDLEMEFRSVAISKGGVLSAIFGGGSKEETTSVKLSTRIYVGDRPANGT